jgi:hypothetical protein
VGSFGVAAREGVEPREGDAHGERSTQPGGQWLLESGFPVGKRYSVEVEDGELVIRAL